MKKLPTIRDVAKHSGFSVASVSYILNNKPHCKFSEETVRKVNEAVEQLGYTPNKMIKALHTGKTQTIGIAALLPTMGGEDKILQGIYSKLNEMRKFDLIFYFSLGKETRDKSVYLDGRSDGVIFPEPLNENVSGYLAQKGFPVVVIHKKTVSPGVAIAFADNFKAGKIATEYLLDLGHRKIAHLAGFLSNWEDARERLAGYRSVMEKRGLQVFDEWIFNRNSWEKDLCQEALEGWLKLPEKIRPTAVFASDDFGAIGLIEAARRIGIKVPEDISIVGCDMHEAGFLCNPPLTTIDMFKKELGEYAVEALVDIIEGASPDKYTKPRPVKLVEKNSAIAYRRK